MVLALGTRLNPVLDPAGLRHRLLAQRSKRSFRSTSIPDRIGLTKRVSVGICGDAKLVAQQILERSFPATAGDARTGRSARPPSIRPSSAWLQALSSAWTTRTTIRARSGTRKRGHARRRPHGATPWPGGRSRTGLPKNAIISSATSATTARSATPIRPSRKAASTWLRGCSGPAATVSRRSSAPRSAVPDVPVVGFAGDGAFGISMNEMTSIGREELAGGHHGHLPQLPVGCRKAQLDPVV